MVLASGGCRVFALVHPLSYAARSRHLSGVISGSWDPSETLELLRKHLASGVSYDWIIFADDPTMQEAARRSREEWLRPWFPVDPAGDKPEVLTLKTHFLEKAAAAGLPVPASRSASSAAELRDAAREIGFPLLVKPSSGFAGNGIYRADSLEELKRQLFIPGTYSIQRVVEGQSGGTAILFQPDRPVWWHSSLRAKVWPEPYGPSSRRRCVYPPEIKYIVQELAPILGMRGFGELEWILPSEGGPPQLIEFNPRPPTYLYLTSFMGANLSAVLRAFFSNQPAPIARFEIDSQEIALFPEDALQAAKQRDWWRLFRWSIGQGGPTFDAEPDLVRCYTWVIFKTLLRSLLHL